MPSDEREDHAIEGPVRFLEQERGLLRRKPAAAGNVRDLRHEARAEEEKGLRAFAEREAMAASLPGS